MRIGALEDATGVSRRLLRYYEEQGLLRPARLANGYRDYSEADVATVRRIRRLLAAGLPTAVINRILDCFHDDDGTGNDGDGDGLMTSSGCAGLTTHLRRERARIAEEIERLQASDQALESILAMPAKISGAPG
ncbi:MerR family transcriptional regulator [Uniformispora flossi]|uniref:MerR family transcriptional regulator n=1 Tax=Uniformispora flossi TaxID=3390723 RepID=UPI003C2EB582